MDYDTQSLEKLKEYTACDISDALLKLKVPGAGLVPDVSIVGPAPEASHSEKGPTRVEIAPASTVIFAPKGATKAFPPSDGYEYPPPNVPSGSHWADLTQPGSFVVIRQPDKHKNAVCGGIMALRIKALQAKGILVWGRVRDVQELKSTGLPIWARGFSTVGAGASCTPWAIQTPINVDGGTIVRPGDIVFSDPENGIVVIPKDLVDNVVALLPQLVEADDKVKADVLKGMKIQEAFKLHRGNL